MDLGFLLHSVIPSWNSVALLVGFFTYLAIVGSIVPAKPVPGVLLPDAIRLHYRCNGLVSLLLLVALLGISAMMGFISPTAISDRGLELLSTTFIFSFLVSLILYFAGYKSKSKGSSLKPHISGKPDRRLGHFIRKKILSIDIATSFVNSNDQLPDVFHLIVERSSNKLYL